MSVGLLLITHNRVGAELLATATRMLGTCPLTAIALSVFEEDDPDRLRREAADCAARLDLGDGVLVLTDLFGSTPSNIAATLHDPGRVRVLAGVNLPMLVRLLNYAGLDLAGLADKALSGGCDGVLSLPTEVASQQTAAASRQTPASSQ